MLFFLLLKLLNLKHHLTKRPRKIGIFGHQRRFIYKSILIEIYIKEHYTGFYYTKVVTVAASQYIVSFFTAAIDPVPVLSLSAVGSRCSIKLHGLLAVRAKRVCNGSFVISHLSSGDICFIISCLWSHVLGCIGYYKSAGTCFFICLLQGLL